MERDYTIKPIKDSDREWVRGLLMDSWGSPRVVTRGKIHNADELPGFIAVYRDEPAGLVTYRLYGDVCEIITLNSLVEGIGIGATLLDSVRDAASAAGCRRIWLITTNDNLHAIRFYQKRGFVLAALHRNAIEQSRKLKPGIPLTGIDGIPLRDEIEMEILL